MIMKSFLGFIKGMILTFFVIFAVAFTSFAVAKAYENTVYLAFGVKKSATEITDDGIRILDFEIKLKNFKF